MLSGMSSPPYAVSYDAADDGKLFMPTRASTLLLIFLNPYRTITSLDTFIIVLF